jgi:hypothetical protein
VEAKVKHDVTIIVFDVLCMKDALELIIAGHMIGIHSHMVTSKKGCDMLRQIPLEKMVVGSGRGTCDGKFVDKKSI